MRVKLHDKYIRRSGIESPFLMRGLLILDKPGDCPHKIIGRNRGLLRTSGSWRGWIDSIDVNYKV